MPLMRKLQLDGMCDFHKLPHCFFSPFFRLSLMSMIKKEKTGLQTMKPPKVGIVVALITPRQSLAKTEEHVKELVFLARTWGLEIVHTFLQRLDGPQAATVVGKGKIEEIAALVKAQNIDYVVFDDVLSPSQVRNLEQACGCCILDRNLLIFNIFAMRAKTKQAKTQIELAQYQYLLPRLTRMWGHLTSQKGGSPGMRGPGEKELETDKRNIQEKITRLRNKLVEIEKQCATRKKSREGFVRVALVGYTNVGKSTLMHLLSKSAVLAEDKLFATVDATIRKIVLNNTPFLLTDTVGFIRKLPHTLVECFKSTLSEIKEADLLLHVIDATHSDYQEHIDVVNKTLQEIGAGDQPRVLVFNKMDLLEQVEERPLASTQVLKPTIDLALKALEGSYRDPDTGYQNVFISATQGLHLDILKDTIAQEVGKLCAARNTAHATFS
jgi:GTP-binding protein HflX